MTAGSTSSMSSRVGSSDRSPSAAIVSSFTCRPARTRPRAGGRVSPVTQLAAHAAARARRRGASSPSTAGAAAATRAGSVPASSAMPRFSDGVVEVRECGGEALQLLLGRLPLVVGVDSSESGSGSSAVSPAGVSSASGSSGTAAASGSERSSGTRRGFSGVQGASADASGLSSGAHTPSTSDGRVPDRLQPDAGRRRSNPPRNLSGTRTVGARHLWRAGPAHRPHRRGKHGPSRR